MPTHTLSFSQTENRSPPSRSQFPWRSRFAWVAAAGVAMLMAACGGGGSSSSVDSGTPSAPANTAQVRAVNAMDMAGAVDVNRGSETLASASSDTPASEFANVSPGMLQGSMVFKGEEGDSVSGSMSADLKAGDKVAVVALGGAGSLSMSTSISSSSSSGTATTSTSTSTSSTTSTSSSTMTMGTVIVHHDRDPIPQDQVGLRLLHAAARVPAVDIYLSSPTADLPATPTVPALAFTQFAPKLDQPTLKAAAGDARVRITLAGRKEVVFDSGTLALPGGQDVFIAAIPSFDGGAPVALLVLPRDGRPSIVREPRASLRAIHASPDAPAVDILVNGKVAKGNLSYRDASRYAHLSAGSVNVKVNPAGNSATSVINATLTLAKDTLYSVFALNKLAAIEPLVIADDGKSAAKGKAKLRVLHASPDVPAVDVYLTPFEGGSSSNQTSTLPATPTIPAISFKTAVPKSGDAALQIDHGNYRVRVTLAGQKTVVYDSGKLRISSRSDFIVAAIPSKPMMGMTTTMSPVDLLLVERRGATILVPSRMSNGGGGEGGMADVRAAHASPDAPNVDVLVDGSKVLGDVPFAAISDYLKVPAGSREIKVNVAGSTTSVISAKVDVARDKGYSVFAINFVDAIKPLVLEDQRKTVFAGARGYIRFAHLSPDAPAVDVLVGSGLRSGGVKYEQVVKYGEISLGEQVIGIALAGSTTPLATTTLNIESGNFYTIAAIGSAAGKAGAKPLRLVNVRDSSANP